MAGKHSEDRRWKGVRKRAWGRWVAEIRRPRSGQRIWLGSYTTAEEARRAYDAAALCLRGNAASLNLPSSPVFLSGTYLSRKQIQSIAAAAAAGAAPAVPAGGDMGVAARALQTEGNIRQVWDEPQAIDDLTSPPPHVSLDTTLSTNSTVQFTREMMPSGTTVEGMMLQRSVQKATDVQPVYEAYTTTLQVHPCATLSSSQLSMTPTPIPPQPGSTNIDESQLLHEPFRAEERSFPLDFAFNVLHPMPSLHNSQIAIPAMAEHFRRRRLRQLSDRTHSSSSSSQDQLHGALQGNFFP